MFRYTIPNYRDKATEINPEYTVKKPTEEYYQGFQALDNKHHSSASYSPSNTLSKRSLYVNGVDVSWHLHQQSHQNVEVTKLSTEAYKSVSNDDHYFTQRKPWLSAYQDEYRVTKSPHFCDCQLCRRSTRNHSKCPTFDERLKTLHKNPDNCVASFYKSEHRSRVKKDNCPSILNTEDCDTGRLLTLPSNLHEETEGKLFEKIKVDSHLYKETRVHENIIKHSDITATRIHYEREDRKCFSFTWEDIERALSDRGQTDIENIYLGDLINIGLLEQTFYICRLNYEFSATNNHMDEHENHYSQSRSSKVSSIVTNSEKSLDMFSVRSRLSSDTSQISQDYLSDSPLGLASHRSLTSISAEESDVIVRPRLKEAVYDHLPYSDDFNVSSPGRAQNQMIHTEDVQDAIQQMHGSETQEHPQSQTTVPVKTRRGSKNRPRTQPNQCLHLWEFLLNLLNSDDYCPKYLAWTRKDIGEFKLIRTEFIANLWGQSKKRKKMTYEKMARALRYYYRHNILEKVPHKRLHFRFGKSILHSIQQTNAVPRPLTIVRNHGKPLDEGS